MAVLALLLSLQLTAQKKELNYFLPQVTYQADIPSPEAYLGYQIGEWHVGHDQLVGYMRELARLSDRVQIEEYARSHERRPLVLLTISSPANLQNIEQIREQHVALSDPASSAQLNTSDMPLVVYEGFGVHGNEASASNAAMLVAYYLAAGQGREIEDLLRQTVVLFDPCFNPDGFNRFASWVNTHKGKHPVADNASRELNEAWPGGRTNHYWFDLNRDWLLVQHPESQGRVRNFHRWKPNILTDHHEMGSNSTFFFQPGIPSRTNPITPARNQELTQEIATFHAKALDQLGSLYYSKESFDDFYYGKGSTYPDANGCIGILFEQASARGHLHESVHGDLSFPFAVRNQVTTALSTLEAGKNLRQDLLNFQREFYQSAQREARQDGVKGYVFHEAHDAARQDHLLELLLQHQIEVYELDKKVTISGQTFPARVGYFVPTEQPQYRLVKAMFSTMTSFTDSLFYDVSAWTLPFAFNIPYEAVNSRNAAGIKGKRVESIAGTALPFIDQSDYAYLFEWDDYYAPRALYQIQKAGLIAKVSHQTFTLSEYGTRQFRRGTILVPVQNQSKPAAEVSKIVTQILQDNSLETIAVQGGLTPGGIDLGSPSFSRIKTPKLLLVVGSGVSSYDAGEAWHLLDHRLDIPVTLVEMDDLGRVDMDKYTAVIMVNGGYSNLRAVDDLKDWVRNGGTLVAMRGAINWASNNQLANVKMKRKGKNNSNGRRPYAKVGADRGAQVIGGAIFEAQLDLSHPLTYGYLRDRLPVFRRGTMFLEPTLNPYGTPVQYTANPLLSGYISKENARQIANSAGVTVSQFGGGKVICMVDNPNFRGFWYGTNRLFLNAVFFGNLIDSRTTERPAPKKK